MANKYTGSGPSRAKNRPNSKDKVAARRTARKESGMSAQKFYVKTRMAEAAKGGKTVNAKDLRKKFQSGEVTRKGFGAPKKKTGGTGSSSTGSSSTGSRKAYGGAKAPKPTWTLTNRNSDGKNTYFRNYSADTYESRLNLGKDKEARKAKGRYGS